MNLLIGYGTFWLCRASTWVHLLPSSLSQSWVSRVQLKTELTSLSERDLSVKDGTPVSIWSTYTDKQVKVCFIWVVAASISLPDNLLVLWFGPQQCWECLEGLRPERAGRWTSIRYFGKRTNPAQLKYGQGFYAFRKFSSSLINVGRSLKVKKWGSRSNWRYWWINLKTACELLESRWTLNPYVRSEDMEEPFSSSIWHIFLFAEDLQFEGVC